MPGKYASDKGARAICDTCGREVKLRTLRYKFVHGKNTNIKQCVECYDPDSPLNWVPDAARAKLPDAIQLRDPRPDTYEKVYQVILQPNTLPPGASNAVIFFIGTFVGNPGLSVTLASLESGITFSSNSIISPQRIIASIYVASNVPAGTYTVTVTDLAGVTGYAQLTIS